MPADSLHHSPLPPTDGDFVVFLVIVADAVLCEERTAVRHGYAGQLALPGGHLEHGEAPETAARREAAEELAIHATSVWFLCALLSAERHVGWYFVVDGWDGDPQAHEAAVLAWIPLTAHAQLALPMDRTAVREYLRLRDAGPRMA